MVTEFEFRKLPEGFRKAGPEDFYLFLEFYIVVVVVLVLLRFVCFLVNP